MKNPSTDLSDTNSKKSQRKRIARQLAAYSVAAGAGALGASDALAAPVPVILPGGGTVILNPSDAAFLDLDGDGNFDFNIENYLGSFAGIGGISFLNSIGTDAISSYSGAYLATLIGAGELIDGSTGGSFGYVQFAELDNFFDTRGFVALKFDIPGGSPHFAYLDVSVDTSTEVITIHGGAYESKTGVGITTIPEPTGLGLLAMGAAGLATWRRKREDATC